MMNVYNETSLVNFVSLVFELGDKNVNIVTYGKPYSEMQPSSPVLSIKLTLTTETDQNGLRK